MKVNLIFNAQSLIIHTLFYECGIANENNEYKIINEL